jgi:hypothetical protein
MKTERTTQHGEAALVEQIDSLQKQLDDCLEKEPKWVKDRRFTQRLCNIMASVFMPLEVYNDITKKHDMVSSEFMWEILRSTVLEQTQFQHLFASADFRRVISGMNKLITDIRRHVSDNDSPDFEMMKDTAQELLHDTNPAGWTLMLEALEIVQSVNGHNIFAAWQIQELRIDLQIIHRCVKMYYEATEPTEG